MLKIYKRPLNISLFSLSTNECFIQYSFCEIFIVAEITYKIMYIFRTYYIVYVGLYTLGCLLFSVGDTEELFIVLDQTFSFP